MPTTLVSELPRVEVHYDFDLPVSGTTLWSNGRWIITVNASEPVPRQRFTLAHELKHVIDHRHRTLLYQAAEGTLTDRKSERAADHFAACLLMPKRWVRQAWVAGHQQVSDLSRMFDVSPQAMRVRLQHLGLLGPAAGSDQRQDGFRSPTYQRPKRPAGGRVR